MLYQHDVILNYAQQQAYLERLGWPAGPGPDPDLPGLTELHRLHMQRLPFENLDIRLRRPLSLEPLTLLDKLLQRRRGGFCYELNYAFYLLLHSLGFRVSLLAGQVYQHGRLGLPYEHLLLGVEIDGQIWLADVGFGDSFRQPLRPDAGPQQEDGASYQAQSSGDGSYQLLQSNGARAAQPLYRFTLEAQLLDSFIPMFLQQQISPESHFTQKSICSLALPDGRVSLANDRLIRSQSGRRSVERVPDARHYRAGLENLFGIELEQSSADYLYNASEQRHPA